jgi:hypothetical protein
VIYHYFVAYQYTLPSGGFGWGRVEHSMPEPIIHISQIEEIERGLRISAMPGARVVVQNYQLMRMDGESPEPLMTQWPTGREGDVPA